MDPELPVAMPSGPFRHVGLSKAARTHRLRKLRTPAKCRECNSYVYFQGAECEEVCGDPEPWAGRGLTWRGESSGLRCPQYHEGEAWWCTPVTRLSGGGGGEVSQGHPWLRNKSEASLG